MSRHDDKVYLRHMLGHVQAAMEMCAGRRRSDLDDVLMLRYALLHIVCILGEAANRVSESGRTSYSIVPWRDIISMRNALIHGYDVVDMDRLWKTIEEDLPVLAKQLQDALD